MALYAAYGSNMDAGQMRERCPHSPTAGTGWIEDWRLTFGGESIGWDGALPTIVPEEGQHVFVLLYDLTEEDETLLDEIEQADRRLYSKIKVRVCTLDGEVVAGTYVLNDYEGGLPSGRLIALMVDAAEKAGAPTEYVADLLSRPHT